MDLVLFVLQLMKPKPQPVLQPPKVSPPAAATNPSDRTCAEQESDVGEGEEEIGDIELTEDRELCERSQPFSIRRALGGTEGVQDMVGAI